MNVKKAGSRAPLRATDHVLAGIAGSDHLAAGLMLRGSTLLRAWFGDSAREPGDLDFVAIPSTLAKDDGYADLLLRELVDEAARISREPTSFGPPVAIDAKRAVWDDIWDYDELPGRRVVLPWDAGRAGRGSVQIDIAFNEELPVAPEPARIPRPGSVGPPLTVLGATPELSLAWKLVWLVNDTFPRRKDLFDAVLLAERVYLPADLLARTFALAGAGRRTPVTEATLLDRLPEARWDHDGLRKGDRVLQHHPRRAVDRLLRALRSTFDAR